MDGSRADFKKFTVKGLREIAGEYNINGRWRMNKSELVDALTNVVYKGNGLRNPKPTILDFQDPIINVPTLIPTKYVEQAQKILYLLLMHLLKTWMNNHH